MIAASSCAGYRQVPLRDYDREWLGALDKVLKHVEAEPTLFRLLAIILGKHIGLNTHSFKSTHRLHTPQSSNGAASSSLFMNKWKRYTYIVGYCMLI